MQRIVNMILRQVVKTGTEKLTADGRPMTPAQREADKRVRKAIKATRRMNRI